MAVREVIEIDEKLCDGCGDCVTACAEGAIAIIDGKARLMSDVYCDGLGACLGHCPQGALKVIQREAEAFDDKAVESHLARQRAEKRGAGAPPQLSVVSQPAMMGSGGCPGSRPQMHQPVAPSPMADCSCRRRRRSSRTRTSYWPRTASRLRSAIFISVFSPVRLSPSHVRSWTATRRYTCKSWSR
jgi:ferredoxin